MLESSEDEIEEDSVHLAGFLKPTASDVESLSLFPFISQESIAMLQKELPSYLAKAEGTAPDVDYLHWWKNNADSLPIWASCAKKILSVQRSSSAAERVFSIINASFHDQQDNALQDYIEASVMLQFNYKGIDA